jgi:hypothetical protein
VITYGRHGRDVIADLTDIPAEVALPGLDGLAADGCVVETARGLTVPNFIEAQEAKNRALSPAERKAEQRARDRGGKAKLAEPLGVSHECHDGHAPVTNVTPYCAVPPVLPVPKEEASPSAPTPRKRAKRERVLSDRAATVADAIEAASGVAYPPASFDALETRLGEVGGPTEDDALAIVRYAAADPFWGAQVRCDPATLFRPKHWPGLLAKAKAAPAKPMSTTKPLTEQEKENLRVYGSNKTMPELIALGVYPEGTVEP